ncbi:MAG: YwaF family protein [Tissierellia bacterium]|nr:YwaF family protein [Tissierellia bacterium]MDD4780034.1 YwaF family protein [Tissierellia bacterium]
MNNFYDNFIKPQNVEPDSMLFSTEHIVMSSLCIVFIVTIFLLQMKHCDVNFSKKILKSTSILMVILEIFRISWSTIYYGFSLKNIRFDWCNQICLILPYIALTKKEKLYPYVDLLAFIGGAGVIIYPAWVFYDYAGIHIMAVQSMISHALMVIIPITIVFISDHWEKENNIKKPFVGFIIIATVAFNMSRLLNVNYLIMLKADGIPLLRHFIFPWYWIIVIPLLIFILNKVKMLFQGIRIKINQRQEEIYLVDNEDNKAII